MNGGKKDEKGDGRENLLQWGIDALISRYALHTVKCKRTPVIPVSTVVDQCACRAVAGQLWKRIGILLAILAALSAGVAIADFIFTYFTFCSPSGYDLTACPSSSPYTDTITFTWIAGGIWGSVTVSILIDSGPATYTGEGGKVPPL